jgi:hypothetical protein
VEKEIIMSDHFDALLSLYNPETVSAAIKVPPGVKQPKIDARIDICDIYAFQKPKDVNKSVIVLNVNPVAPTYADSFSSEAVYELKVDTNGDAVADIAYRFTFSPKEDGMQKANVRRVSGEQAKGNGNDGEVIFQDVPVAFGEEATTADAGEYRFFAGIRSDPFFFDLEGAKNGMQFTGADTFRDKNVFSIVLETPNSALGNNPKLGIWFRVLIPKDGNPFFQIDRMGRPFVNVVFTKQEDKDTFNRIEPTRDRELFTKKFADLLESSGHSPKSAQQTALTLLPDILDYNYSSSKGYRNGRKLTDDIIDIQLAVLTNGRVTTDKAGPHQDLLTTFPYLGPPHPAV